MRCHPSAERNKAAIKAVLAEWLPRDARVLEIASGGGQHAEHCAAEVCAHWQPTDSDASWLVDIAERCAQVSNIAQPEHLDACDLPWPFSSVDVVFTANLLHISPPKVSEALFEGAAQALSDRGQLLIYGPFSQDGVHNSEGNERFDADLKGRDPSWGIRDISWLLMLAQGNGLVLAEQRAMPANNWMLRFQSRN